MIFRWTYEPEIGRSTDEGLPQMASAMKDITIFMRNGQKKAAKFITMEKKDGENYILWLVTSNGKTGEALATSVKAGLA